MNTDIPLFMMLRDKDFELNETELSYLKGKEFNLNNFDEYYKLGSSKEIREFFNKYYDLLTQKNLIEKVSMGTSNIMEISGDELGRYGFSTSNIDNGLIVNISKFLEGLESLSLGLSEFRDILFDSSNLGNNEIVIAMLLYYNTRYNNNLSRHTFQSEILDNSENLSYYLYLLIKSAEIKDKYGEFTFDPKNNILLCELGILKVDNNTGDIKETIIYTEESGSFKTFIEENSLLVTENSIIKFDNEFEEKRTIFFDGFFNLIFTDGLLIDDKNNIFALGPKGLICFNLDNGNVVRNANLEGLSEDVFFELISLRDGLFFIGNNIYKINISDGSIIDKIEISTSSYLKEYNPEKGLIILSNMVVFTYSGFNNTLIMDNPKIADIIIDGEKPSKLVFIYSDNNIYLVNFQTGEIYDQASIEIGDEQIFVDLYNIGNEIFNGYGEKIGEFDTINKKIKLIL